MRILVTAGGTTEYIDDVRVLTNISTGKLGCIIADHAITEGHEVSIVAPRNMPHWPSDRVVRYVATNAASVMELLQRLVPKHDIVIHAMAVSDFTFDRTIPIKLKSNDPEAFIESMRARIRPNPKIISHIKTWNPNCILVGFKFEVGLTAPALQQIAFESLLKNQCDFVVANDKEEMKREGAHIAYLIPRGGAATRMEGKSEIAEKVIEHATHAFGFSQN